MLLKNEGFPEENELVMCTITKVQYHSVFATLDEYQGKSGMIHISEVSPGRIRNIRDFVREGKKVVCIVLKVNPENGHIDLSLRRVNEAMKKAKVNEIKRQQLAERIVEFVAKQEKADMSKIYSDIMDKIEEKYDTIYDCFEDVVTNEGLLEKIGIEKNLAAALEENIKQRIKETKVKIEGKFKITTYEPEGVEIIKKALKKAKDTAKDNIHISYYGGGSYYLSVEAKDFKEAEKILKKSTESVIKIIEENKGTAEFLRKDKKNETHSKV